MTLSAQEIRRLCSTTSPLIDPFSERTEFNGTSYGLSPAGYDVRIAQSIQIEKHGFILASTIERFDMPPNIIGIVHDKSTWARRGLAVQNTVIEPGWRGWLTLELTSHLTGLQIDKGSGIAQIIFHKLSEPTELVYNGKYQDQGQEPTSAR